MRSLNLLFPFGGLLATARATSLLSDTTDAVSKRSIASPLSCSLDNSWEDHTLFQGVAAPATETSDAINLALHLPKAQISGDLQIELVDDFLLEPKVRVGLGNIQAYVEVDVSASAGVHEAVELFISPELEIEIPGLLEIEASVAVALDLVIGLEAAVDLSTGVYISFGEAAYVEISLLTKDIVDVSLDGLVAKALPLGIAAGVDLSTELAVELGLRLRTEIDLGADVEIPVLPIEAGAKVAIWVSLFDYTSTIVATDSCVVSVAEQVALTLGLDVQLDVDIGDILDLSLAPSLTITLAKAEDAKLCLSSRGVPGVFLEGLSTSTISPVTSTAVSDPSTGIFSGVPSSFSVTPFLTSTTGAKSTSQGSGEFAVATASQINALDPAESLSVGSLSTDANGAPSLSTGISETTAADPAETTSVESPSLSAAGAQITGTNSDAAYSAKDPMTTVAPTMVHAISHGNSSTTPRATLTAADVTSTLTSTHTYTITSCAASVVNCPARYTQKVITSTIRSTTYVCPLSNAHASATLTSASVSTAPVVSVTTITESLTTIVPCSQRATSTFHAPTNVPAPEPTITIKESTTVCPLTMAASTSMPATYATSGFQIVTTAITPAVVPPASTPAISSKIPSAPYSAKNGTASVFTPIPGVSTPTSVVATPTPGAANPTGTLIPVPVAPASSKPISSTTPGSTPSTIVTSDGEKLQAGAVMILACLALMI